MTREELESFLSLAIVEFGGELPEDLDADLDIREAVGLDSLGTLELLAEIEDRFDFFFDDDAMPERPTLNDLLDEIEKNLSQKAKETA